MEGVSLAPLMNDPTSEVKEVALTQTPRPNYPRGELPEVMGYSIRTQRYRYTEWRDFHSGQVQAGTLRPRQRSAGDSNVAGHENLQIVVAELEQRLDRVVGTTLNPD